MIHSTGVGVNLNARIRLKKGNDKRCAGRHILQNWKGEKNDQSNSQEKCTHRILNHATLHTHLQGRKCFLLATLQHSMHFFCSWTCQTSLERERERAKENTCTHASSGKAKQSQARREETQRKGRGESLWGESNRIIRMNEELAVSLHSLFHLHSSLSHFLFFS